MINKKTLKYAINRNEKTLKLAITSVRDFHDKR